MTRRLNWHGPSSGVWNAVIGRSFLANDISGDVRVKDRVH